MSHPRILDRSKTALVVVDIQEVFRSVISDFPQIASRAAIVVRGFQLLGLPVIITEQYPKGLGSTTEAIRNAFVETYGAEPIEKMCFSSYGCAQFVAALEALGRKQILVAGIETQVCVYQTVRDLLSAGYEVTVIADAVSSRTPENRQIALERMQSDGAKIASTEMALFEMTVNAGTEEFRAISRLVK